MVTCKDNKNEDNSRNNCVEMWQQTCPSTRLSSGYKVLSAYFSHFLVPSPFWPIFWVWYTNLSYSTLLSSNFKQCQPPVLVMLKRSRMTLFHHSAAAGLANLWLQFKTASPLQCLPLNQEPSLPLP